MRILLAQNALYYPSYGGGDRSNRLLMEALAARGHACRVVARIARFRRSRARAISGELAARAVSPMSTDGGVVVFRRTGVEAHVVTQHPNLRAYFAAQIAAFAPDAILTSTDDPAQLLLEVAVRADARAGLPRARHAGAAVRPGLRLPQRGQNGGAAAGRTRWWE